MEEPAKINGDASSLPVGGPSHAFSLAESVATPHPPSARSRSLSPARSLPLSLSLSPPPFLPLFLFLFPSLSLLLLSQLLRVVGWVRLCCGPSQKLPVEGSLGILILTLVVKQRKYWGQW